MNLCPIGKAQTPISLENFANLIMKRSWESKTQSQGEKKGTIEKESRREFKVANHYQDKCLDYIQRIY